ncbi:GNAT family protein [Nocardioides fonticola]|uniref:GNAT family N-acetyltransferase n=1 Tax=Nocardioides fonticola TaxID=450363 RepID=UPI0031D2F2B7
MSAHPVGPIVAGWTPRPMPQRVAHDGRWVRAVPIAEEHAADLAELCLDEDLWTYRPAVRPRDVEEVRTELIAPLAQRTDAVVFAFVPTTGPTAGRASGLASLFPIVPGNGVAEISGVLWSKPMQRTAASTEAVHLLLGHLLDDLGYRRVEWKCDSLNEPSRRAALRLGFTEEGRFRQHMVTHGRSRDTDWFSIIDTEWPALRERHRRWLDPANHDADGVQRRRLADC